VRPFDLDQPNVIATSREWGWGDIANVNVLKFEAGHPICHLWRDQLLDLQSKKDAHGLGPVGMQLLLREHPEYNNYLVPPEIFNPVAWIHVRYMIEHREPFWHKRTISRLLGRSPQIGRITPETRAIHLWHEIWRQQGYHADARYPSGTLYEQLRRRYGVGAPALVGVR